MSEDRIDSIIDTAAIQNELSFTEGGVQELIALIKSLKGTAINISTAKSVSEFNALRIQLDALTKQTNAAAVATIHEAKVRRESAAATKEHTKTLSEFQKMQSKVAIAAKEEDRALSASRATLAEVNKENKLRAALQNSVNGSLQEAQAKVAILKNELLKLADVEGINTVKATELRKAIDTQNDFIDRNSDALARQKINIGNYTGQIGFLGRSIRGLGALGSIISNAIGIDPTITTSIHTAGNALIDLNHTMHLSTFFKTENAAATQVNTAATVENAVATKSAGIAQRLYTFIVGESVGAMKALKIAMAATGIGLLILGVTALVSIFKNMHSEADFAQKSLEKFNDEIERNKKLIDSLTKSAKFDFDKELADIKRQGIERLKLAKDDTDKVKIENENKRREYSAELKFKQDNIDALRVQRNNADKDEAEEAKKQQEYLAFLKGGGKLSTVAGLNDKEKEALKTRLEARRKEAADTKQSLEEAQRDLILFKKDEAQRLTEAELKEIEDARKRGEDANKKRLEILERNRKAEFDIKAAELQFEIESNQKIANDKDESYYKRLIAARKFYNASQELIVLQAEFEKKTAGKTSKELEAIDIKAGYDLAKNQQDFLDMRLKAKEDFDKAFLGDEAKLNEGLNKLAEEAYKNFKHWDDERAKTKEKNDKDIADARKKEAELEKQLLQDVTDFAFTVIESRFEKEKNAIQDQINLLDQKKAKDIEVANQTIANVTDRANAITIIEARAAAQRKVLEDKQKQIDEKKAQVEKARSIISIIEKTAENEVDALKYLTNPITAPLYPVIAALVAAIGAVQLATVIAQPIPHYAEGGEHKHTGPAIVGDAGRSEGIVLPDGTVLKTPATHTMMNLPAGSKIYKDYNKMMFNATLTQPPSFSRQTQSDTATPLIVAELKDVKRAIEKIPQSQVVVENLISRRIRNGSSISNHITRNLP